MGHHTVRYEKRVEGEYENEHRICESRQEAERFVANNLTWVESPHVYASDEDGNYRPTISVDITTQYKKDNVFAMLGAFRRYAYAEGWPDAAIEAVLDRAKEGDHKHLVATLKEHIEVR